MWDTLGKFLMEQASENVRFADELLGIFQKPSTKAYLFFLEFTLDTFNKYNAKFQTRKSLIHELQPYSMELLLWFLRKFIKLTLLKPETLGDIVRKLNFSDHNNQLPLEEIDFGFECKEYLQEQLNQEICSKMEVDLIRENCLQFYIKASEQIRNRLPIDSFLYNVAVFENKTALFDCNRDSTVLKVLQVNRRLGKLVDERLVEKEWKYLYEIDTVTKNEWSKLCFDDMWIKISLFSTDKGELHFPNLRLLLSVVRTLPHSNAEAERVFSLIPDAKTKKRNSISIETLNSICVIRYALKDNDKTARTMTVTREHLNLMENIYENVNLEQKNELTLYAQDNDNNLVNINLNKN